MAALTVPVYRIGPFLLPDGTTATEEAMVSRVVDMVRRDGIETAIVEAPTSLHYVAGTEELACHYMDLHAAGLLQTTVVAIEFTLVANIVANIR